MRVATKAALESRGLRKKFLSHLEITLVRTLSVRERSFLRTKKRTMINAGCVGRHWSNLVILFSEFIGPNDIIALHAFLWRCQSQSYRKFVYLLKPANDDQKQICFLSFRDEDEATPRKTFAFDGTPEKTATHETNKWQSVCRVKRAMGKKTKINICLVA